MPSGSALGLRRAGAVGLLTTVAGAAAWAGPAPAQATAYRYWTYWTSQGSGWSFSQVGPASTRPADGSTEGWRFALSTGTRGQGAQPRIDPATAFQRFCGDDVAGSGRKRVAVVFDFGTQADAAPGQHPPEARGTCVVIDDDATGGQVLARAADVRVGDGLVCGIGGYPAGECAPAVATPSPRPRPAARDEVLPREPRDRSRPDPAPPRPDDPSPDAATPVQPGPDDEPGAPPTDDREQETPPETAARRSPGGTVTVGVPAATTTGSAPTTTATTAPVFTEAEARDPDRGAPPVWPLLGLAALAGLVGYLGWRRATGRRG